MAGIFIFDTLQYVKRLKEAGVGEKAAEVQAEALKEVIDNNLATKSDIYDLKRDIEVLKTDVKRDISTVKRDIEVLRADVKRDISTVKRDIEVLKTDVKRDIEVIKKDLTIRMGGMLSVAIGVIGVLITLVDRLH